MIDELELGFDINGVNGARICRWMDMTEHGHIPMDCFMVVVVVDGYEREEGAAVIGNRVSSCLQTWPRFAT
jgi:hypothetical protein